MRVDSASDLALRAIHSTASSLSPGDAILLLIDGGYLDDPEPYRQAASPVPLLLRSSPEQRGLASGLNALLDEVLVDPRWQLIARMDADDESLPGRMEEQRGFLEAHPEVDILGTACVEVNEQDCPLQIKRMPLGHAKIVRTLPRRNPLNHPTVMLRRRVFASGLRYRTDVHRTEDYHLWIDAIKQGFIIANLPQPLLNFRRDSTFFVRRGGFRQAWADMYVRLRAIRVLGLRSPLDLIWAGSAFMLRLLPGRVQTRFYNYLR